MMSHFFAPESWSTPDFIIRCYRAGDGRLLQEAANASYDHLHTFLRWPKPDTTAEDQEARIRMMLGKYLSNQDYEFGVFALDGKRLLGGAAFLLRGHSVAEGATHIGMWIAAAEAGKGLGTQVLQQLLRWGFTEWPWLRIEWRCDTRNVASAAVARKNGLRLEGTLRQDILLADGNRRDTHVFAMLRDEFLRRQVR